MLTCVVDFRRRPDAGLTGASGRAACRAVRCGRFPGRGAAGRPALLHRPPSGSRPGRCYVFVTVTRHRHPHRHPGPPGDRHPAGPGGGGVAVGWRCRVAVVVTPWGRRRIRRVRSRGCGVRSAVRAAARRRPRRARRIRRPTPRRSCRTDASVACASGPRPSRTGERDNHTTEALSWTTSTSARKTAAPGASCCSVGFDTHELCGRPRFHARSVRRSPDRVGDLELTLTKIDSATASKACDRGSGLPCPHEHACAQASGERQRPVRNVSVAFTTCG